MWSFLYLIVWGMIIIKNNYFWWNPFLDFQELIILISTNFIFNVLKELSNQFHRIVKAFCSNKMLITERSLYPLFSKRSFKSWLSYLNLFKNVIRHHKRIENLEQSNTSK